MTEGASQLQRSRNVSRNLIFGYINRFFALLLPFIVRTALIYRFGAVYLGVNSLFASIFQALNLAELGFSTAIVYSLYKPVAEEDTETVCAYLGTYRTVYRVIGLVILAAGLAVMPFFPYLLKGSDVPGDVNLFAWYLIFLADAVLSYLLFGYKTAIPSALQRNDLLSKVDTVALIGKSLLQMTCLLFTKNFYFYLLCSLLFTVVRNVLVSEMVRRRFPQYQARGRIDAAQFGELKQLVGGLFLSKARGASRHMIDSICITAFVSLTMTAIYSNYFLVLNAVISLSGILCAAMTASVGNSIAVENREKNYADMRRFNFMYLLLAGWAAICMFCLYQPFTELWVGRHLMLGMREVVALCLYFYVLKMGDMRWIYHEGSGLWWKARYIVIAEIVCNIVLNIVLAKYWGVLGIIVATLLSLFFINFLGGSRILFKEYFKNGKLGEFFRDQALYFCVTAVIAVLCWRGCEEIGGWLGGGSAGMLGLVARLLLCTIVTLAGYYLAYHRTARYKDAKDWVWNRYSAMNLNFLRISD